MYIVYILQSLNNGKTYTGFTKNMVQRLLEHNKGNVDATKNRRPLKILYTEEIANLADAKDRERYWKSGAGRRKIRKFFS
ncbi:MAG: GIY-YIG nuclease family protein [Patescibacteria group bacterium]|mgnify:CR=1 FL=1